MAQAKRVTVYLEPAPHCALRVKAAETDSSVSELVNNSPATPPGMRVRTGRFEKLRLRGQPRGHPTGRSSRSRAFVFMPRRRRFLAGFPVGASPLFASGSSSCLVIWGQSPEAIAPSDEIGKRRVSRLCGQAGDFVWP